MIQVIADVDNCRRSQKRLGKNAKFFTCRVHSKLLHKIKAFKNVRLISFKPKAMFLICLFSDEAKYNRHTMFETKQQWSPLGLFSLPPLLSKQNSKILVTIVIKI